MYFSLATRIRLVNAWPKRSCTALVTLIRSRSHRRHGSSYGVPASQGRSLDHILIVRPSVSTTAAASAAISNSRGPGTASPVCGKTGVVDGVASPSFTGLGVGPGETSPPADRVGVGSGAVSGGGVPVGVWVAEETGAGVCDGVGVGSGVGARDEGARPTK